MEIKLINGKWKAVFENTQEDFNSLTDVQKKLFSLLLNCEIIIYKSNLKTENDSILKQNIEKIKASINATKNLLNNRVNLYNNWIINNNFNLKKS